MTTFWTIYHTLDIKKEKKRKKEDNIYRPLNGLSSSKTKHVHISFECIYRPLNGLSSSKTKHVHISFECKHRFQTTSRRITKSSDTN